MLQTADLIEVIDTDRKPVLFKAGFVYNLCGTEVEMSETRDIFRNLGLVSSMGISVVLAIAIGVWFGLFLDRWLGTAPWFFWIFLLIGIAAGFKNVYLITGREIKKLNQLND